MGRLDPTDQPVTSTAIVFPLSRQLTGEIVRAPGVYGPSPRGRCRFSCPNGIERVNNNVRKGRDVLRGILPNTQQPEIPGRDGETQPVLVDPGRDRAHDLLWLHPHRRLRAAVAGDTAQPRLDDERRHPDRVGIIILFWLLTGYYVYRANKEFEAANVEIIREAEK